MVRFDSLNETCLRECLVTQALSGLCVGLILTNGSGRVVWLNRAASRVLGRPADECLGQSLPTLLRDLHLAAFWQEAAHSDGNTMAEVTVEWPEKMSLKANATRYVDTEGREVGRALLFCDVTAERAIQVQLTEEVANRLLDLAGTQAQSETTSALTQQEIRVLRLVGRGLRNEDIAKDAGIAPATVRSHLKRVYRKLGLASRAEAVRYAVRHHIV